MPKEKQTVTGTIKAINPWDSGKGGFIVLEDDSTDYYYFSKPPAKIGDTGVFETKPGTKNFSDKVQLVKTVLESRTEKAMQECADKDIKILKDSIASGEKTYFDKQNLIVRQTCIKSACVVVAELKERSKTINIPKTTEEILDVAEKLYEWIIEQEPLPEPPGEEK